MREEFGLNDLIGLESIEIPRFALRDAERMAKDLGVSTTNWITTVIEMSRLMQENSDEVKTGIVKKAVELEMMSSLTRAIKDGMSEKEWNGLVESAEQSIEEEDKKLNQEDEDLNTIRDMFNE